MPQIKNGNAMHPVKNSRTFSPFNMIEFVLGDF